MGADRGVLISLPGLADGGGRAVARAVAAGIARLGSVALVLTGQASAVSGTGSLPGRLAALLGGPVALDAQCLELEAGGIVRAITLGEAGAVATRLAPGLDPAAPAVASIAVGLRRPRYPHAARIANAYRAGLVETWQPADLGLDAQALASDVEPRGLVLGPERAPAQILGGTIDETAAQFAEILARRLR